MHDSWVDGLRLEWVLLPKRSRSFTFAYQITRTDREKAVESQKILSSDEPETWYEPGEICQKEFEI